MQTVRDIAPYVAIAAAAVGTILAVLLLVLWTRVRRLSRGQRLVLGAHGERDIVQHTQELEDQVRNLRMAVEDLDARLVTHKGELDHAFSNRAVVRYDAFRDIGGEQSASLALLDRHHSGIVVSSIHSRDYARLYVKQLRNGTPDRTLSPEEVEVVRQATAGSTPAAMPATSLSTRLQSPPPERGPRPTEPVTAPEPSSSDPSAPDPSSPAAGGEPASGPAGSAVPPPPLPDLLDDLDGPPPSHERDDPTT
jgi:hypothetical protein